MMTKKNQEQPSSEVDQSLDVSTDTISNLPAAAVVGPDAERFRAAKTPVASPAPQVSSATCLSPEVTTPEVSASEVSASEVSAPKVAPEVAPKVAADTAVASATDVSSDTGRDPEPETVAESPPKPTTAPLSSETLFAFALPEAIRRNLIADATTIFKHSDLEKILKEHNLPADALSRDTTPPPPSSASARPKWVLPAFFVLLYLAALAFLYVYFEL